MKFKIDKKVFEKFPNLVVAIPIIMSFDNSKAKEESVEFLRVQETKLRERFTLETFLQDKKVEVYNQTFRDFGVDPEKFLPAHVALSKRVLEGGSLPDINPIVNIYNAMSIKYTTPFGGEDLDTLYGDFVLKFASGGEQWIPIGGGKSRPAQKGELVWGDAYDLSTKALNWRQCDRTKLTSESKNGYFVMDGFDGVNRDVIKEASVEFVELMSTYFGGEGKIYWLNKDNPEFEIPFKSKDDKVMIESVKSGQAKPKVRAEKKYFGMAKEIYESLRKITGLSDFNLEIPERAEFGDYSSNIAMTFKGGSLQGVDSKSGDKNPRELAEEIKTKLGKLTELNKLVDKIEVAGPGFINFYLSKQVFFDVLVDIKEQSDTFGRNQTKKGKKVIIEYTDPNPFKEFHVGHVYSNTVGESIARLIEAQGANVWRADYFGDVGMHVAKAIWGLLKKFEEESKGSDPEGSKGRTLSERLLASLKGRTLKERIEYFGQAYALGATEYEEGSDSAKDEMKELNFLIFRAAQDVVLPQFEEKAQVNYDQYIKEGKYKFEEIKEIYEVGRGWSMEYFESIYKRLGMKFAGYYPESRTGEFGYGMVLDGLTKGIFEKGEKGAIIFPGEKYGLHNRVFINSLGLPTYETKDFGNAVVKYKDFAYDESLIITGNEINEYFVVVLKALGMYKKELADATTHLGHGMVRLPEGKMSSRTGKIVRGEWVLDETKKRALEVINKNESFKDSSPEDKENTAEIVAQGAIKYALLKQGIGGNIEFDFETSLSFDGNSGPYIQYTYARCMSVINKALGNSKLGNRLVTSAYSLVPNSEEQTLLRVLNHFPEVVQNAAESFAPNLLCNYIYDLAQKFNGFYNKHKILGFVDSEPATVDRIYIGKRITEHGPQTTEFRLFLTSAVGQVIKNGLNILGISAPERM